MPYVIVEDQAKYRVKEYDENGNSLGLKGEEFENRQDAEVYLVKLENGVGSEESNSGNETVESAPQGELPRSTETEKTLEADPALTVFTEVSAIEQIGEEGTDGEEKSTRYTVVRYTSDPEGKKNILSTESVTVDGLFSAEEVLEQVKLTAEDKDSVVWAEEVSV